jgi:hypothetical protein
MLENRNTYHTCLVNIILSPYGIQASIYCQYFAAALSSKQKLLPASTQTRTKTLPTRKPQAVKTSRKAQPTSDAAKTTQVVTQAILTSPKSTTTSTDAISSTATTITPTKTTTATTVAKKTTPADDDYGDEDPEDTEVVTIKSDLPDTTEPCFPHQCAKDVQD